jgi:hypothetical protein
METIENYISILPTKTIKTQKKKDTSTLALETASKFLVTHRKLLAKVLLGTATVLLGKKMIGCKNHKKSMFISASSDGVSSANISTQHIRVFSKDKSNPNCFQVCLHGGTLVGSSDNKWTVCKAQFPRSYRYLSESVKI